MPGIKISNLTFTYENRDSPALSNINLSVERGDFLLLAGQSGSGKSTLIKCVNGLIPHRYVGSYKGEVVVGDRPVVSSNFLELSLTVGTVLQEVEKQLVSPLVEDEVAFGPSNLALSREEVGRRVDSAIDALDLSQLRRRFTFALSGGQKQRLAIADIVAMEPGIILFDEPLANLDSQAVKLMQGTFQSLVDEGKTLLVSEHRTEEVLKAKPNRIVVMDQGKIVGEGKDPIVLAEFADVLKVPAEYVVASRSKAALPAPRPSPVEEGPELVACENLSVEYSGGIRALKGVSLSIHEGERVAVLGNNGAGKSTLALAMTGLVRPTQGAVLIHGKDSRKMLVSEVARTIAVVFQSPFLMLFSKTVRSELAFGPKNLGVSTAEISGVIPEVAKECGVEHLLDGSPYASSFGEKKRICVGSILTMRPECIILDEPTAGQDYASYTRFMNFILSARSLKSFIVITHDPDLAIDYTDRAIVMHEGEVMADGKTEELLADEEILSGAAIRETSLITLSKKYTGGKRVLSTVQLVKVSSNRIAGVGF